MDNILLVVLRQPQAKPRDNSAKAAASAGRTKAFISNGPI